MLRHQKHRSSRIASRCKRAPRPYKEYSMDSSRFDEFTKFLARRPSRRQMLKGMLASVFGGALSSLGLENAFAATCNNGPGQPCASTQPRCCNGAVCSGGTCV